MAYCVYALGVIISFYTNINNLKAVRVSCRHPAPFLRDGLLLYHYD